VERVTCDTRETRDTRDIRDTTDTRDTNDTPDTGPTPVSRAQSRQRHRWLCRADQQHAPHPIGHDLSPGNHLAQHLLEREPVTRRAEDTL